MLRLSLLKKRGKRDGLQYILPKGFKRTRYYGVQATKTFEQVKGIIQEALSKVKKVVKGAIKIIEQKRYRERYMESTGKDPFVCPHKALSSYRF